MSPPLLPEVFNLIVDNLSDEPRTLNACCAVSKSWVPHARRHLFYSIRFSSHIQPIEQWTKVFPDPSNSPAHLTRALCLSGITTVAAAGTHARAWVHTFCHISELKLTAVMCEGSVQFSLVPLYGLSPTLKSLSLNYLPAPPQELLNLICSFPLLENLFLNIDSRDDDTAVDEWEAPLNSPNLAGSLHLCGRIRPIALKLLDFPNGLHPAKITLVCDVEFASSARGLLLRCSDTLESLYIGYSSESSACSSAPQLFNALPLLMNPGTLPPPCDLSKFTRLKYAWFSQNLAVPNVQWITTTLQTAKSMNLQQIDISSPLDLVVKGIEPMIGQAWQELDYLLTQLWLSRSIHPKIALEKRWGKGEPTEVGPILLPQLTKRGFVEFPWAPQMTTRTTVLDEMSVVSIKLA